MRRLGGEEAIIAGLLPKRVHPINRAVIKVDLINVFLRSKSQKSLLPK